MFDRLVQAVKTQSSDRIFLVLGVTNRALFPSHVKFCHSLSLSPVAFSVVKANDCYLRALAAVPICRLSFWQFPHGFSRFLAPKRS